MTTRNATLSSVLVLERVRSPHVASRRTVLTARPATGHTLLGGVAGHIVGKHGHERAQEAGVGVGPGTTQPSTLNKILGTVESGVGKLVHNPSMVAQGQAKKAGLQTSNAGGAGGVGY